MEESKCEPEYDQVNDVKPILEGIELESYGNPADPGSPEKRYFRQPDDNDTSTIGDDMFVRSKRSKLIFLLKVFIALAVVVAIIVGIVCLVVFLGHKPSSETSSTPRPASPYIRPTRPTRPTQPTQPTRPTRPSQPTQPMRPTRPTRPTQPTQPTRPTRPTQSTQPSRPTPRPSSAVPTAIPRVVVGDINVDISATLGGLAFDPAYNDTSSAEYMSLVMNLTNALNEGFQNSNISDHFQSITITSVREGSIIVEATATVAGTIGADVVSEQSSSVAANDLQLMIANSVTAACNSAVTSSLSNNSALGTGEVNVVINDVEVPINVDGVDLPPEITPGAPCPEWEFRCNNGSCINAYGKCNYVDECATGEDEINCGECTDGQWQCANSKCIPSYFRCDFIIDCQDRDDEIDCGSDHPVGNLVLEEGTPIQISSPGYPNHYAPKQTLFWSITTADTDLVIHVDFIDFDLSVQSAMVFGTGNDVGTHENYTAVFYHQFHPRQFLVDSNLGWMGFYAGAYGYSRGFMVELNAIDSSAFVPGTCAPGEFQCETDGECISSAWRCDNIRDCAGNEDETNCESLPPPGSCTEPEHQFQCSDGTCIHGSYLCDYYVHCFDAGDELNCPCDADNQFQCSSGRCLPEVYVCDWFLDCADASDETACGTPNNTASYFLQPGQLVNISSPNFPEDFGVGTYYAYTFSTNTFYVIEITFHDFETQLGSFLTVGNGLDLSNINSAIVAYSHFSNPTSVTSSGGAIWIEIHGGPHGFGRVYATAKAVPFVCDSEEFRCPEKCISLDFKCDFFHDCINGEDEFECGHANRTKDFVLRMGDVVNFTSPNYPQHYPGDLTSAYWTFTSDVEGDYIIRFRFNPYSISNTSFVVFGNGLDISNQTSVFDIYIGRTNVYTVFSQEDKVWVEFYAGYDGNPYPGFFAIAEAVHRSDIPINVCSRDEYACDDGFTCIPATYQCDGIHDCPSDGEDELDCDECLEHQFPCPEKCISLSFKCDFFHDCDYGEDEEGCGWESLGVAYTLNVGDIIEVTSPLYPEPDPGNFSFYYYTFTVTDPGYHLLFNFSFFNVSEYSYISFGLGIDFVNQSSFFEVFHAKAPPTKVYGPSNQMWMDFFTGFQGYPGFVIIVSTYRAGVIPPVTCGFSEWACLDGQNCIPASYRCDGYHHCPANGEDEHGCPSACREYEFECKNGECLPLHRHCNGVPQCSEGEDEVGCGYQGTCTANQFKCADGMCIPEHQRCNYFYDCPDGSDEAQTECGQCNALDEFTCGFGNCIPDYWICDFFFDCSNGEDESNCDGRHGAEIINLAMNERYNITSPNWPNSSDPVIYKLWHISGPEGTVIHFDFLDFELGLQSFLLFSDGLEISNRSQEFAVYHYRFNPVVLLSHTNQVSVQFYSGLYVGSRGVFISMVAVHPHGHDHPACQTTAYQCAEDGECIPEYWVCDGYFDCIAFDDEQNCTYPPPGICGTYTNEYQCEETDICIHADFRCDYTPDCPNHDDEFNCDCSDDKFRCESTGQCLPRYLVCNFYSDCIGGNNEDEIACGLPEDIQHYSLDDTNSITIQSPGYPQNYDASLFVVYQVSTPSGFVALIVFTDFDLDWQGFLAFGSGIDYNDRSAAFAVYDHHDDPDKLYTPTGTFNIQFHGGPYGRSRGFEAVLHAVEKSIVPSSPPLPTCPPDTFTCHNGTCIRGTWECDGINDCLEMEDELRCYASGGTCQSHQYTCSNGQCIHGSWRCDGINDCFNGEDEQECGVRCQDESEFTCEVSQECVPLSWLCDYIPDCMFGEDETQCGECNNGYFNCSNGACVLDYYVCDAYEDCLGGDDEIGCGNPENTENIILSEGELIQIQSPGYPNPHDSLCYYLWTITAPEGLYIHVIFTDFSVSIHTYLSFGVGLDPDNSSAQYAVYYHRTAPHQLVLPASVAWIEFHCGLYGHARGFDLAVTTTNISTHVFPDCRDGDVQCNDGHCIPSHFLCDSERDCSMGEDEGHGGLTLNCTVFDHGACGTHETEFQCSDGRCIHADYLCDQIYDCPDGGDEINCTRPCTEHEFECPGHQCIPQVQRCDGYLNCIRTYDDELNCANPENAEYIFLYQNSTNITSKNYPNEYPKNEYHVTYISTIPGHVIRATIHDLDLSVATLLFFGNGDNISDFSNIFDFYQHRTNYPPEIYSDSNMMYVEFHSGIFGGSQGYSMLLEAVNKSVVIFPPCAVEQFQCINDGTCIPAMFECDNYIDCGDMSDETNCQASGGTCQPHQYVCSSGQCIHGSYQCDGYVDCPDSSDEINCGDFSCPNSSYSCEVSEMCIPLEWQCDYFPDCTFGEDETSCGDCAEGYFNCTDGACVPDYYVCDAYADCLTETDEMDCGNINNTEYINLAAGDSQTIRSPGYPEPHDSLCFYQWIITVPDGLYPHIVFNDFSVVLHTYLAFGTGSDPDVSASQYAVYYHRTNPREVVIPGSVAWMTYHCGLYGQTRGFDITITTTDILTHVFPNCTEGEFMCNDGHCIPSHFLCDTTRDCSMGEDEGHTGNRVNCSSYVHTACGTHATEYQCNVGFCIHEDYRCDSVYDCPMFLDDELNCPTPCRANDFECPDQQCIHTSQRCDFFLDCVNGDDDERNCGTPENSQYIYVFKNSTNITSVNYPNHYPKSKYTVTYIRTEPGYVIRVTFVDTELSVGTYLAFGNGPDTQDFDMIFEVYTNGRETPSEIRSITNEIFIEFHTGIFAGSRGYFLTIDSLEQEDIVFPPCDFDEFQCPSDGNCIPAVYECDNIIDCGYGGDEILCQTIGGSCQPHQFTCNDGGCIHENYECDLFRDCADNSDEEYCPFACPFPSIQFNCNRSRQCISRSQQCNFIANCEFGEDEEDCGTCAPNFIECSNGGCVPPYYRCDGENDCFDGEDETNCDDFGTIENVALTETSVVQLTSPNYPQLYGTNCYYRWEITAPQGLVIRFHFKHFDLGQLSYFTIGSGLDHNNSTSLLADYHHRYRPRERVTPGNLAWAEFHCGSIGGGRGFDVEVTAVNLTTHVHAECDVGEYTCSDYSCIPTFDLCDGVKNCPLSEDENENCTTFSNYACGTHANEWQCADGFFCIHGYYRCDGIFDCLFGDDELNCSCTVGEFECASQQCIPASFRCDNIRDCLDGNDDEVQCDHPNNTMLVNITSDQPYINITSPDYPNNYQPNEYVVTFVTAPIGEVVMARIIDLELSISSFVVFNNGHGTDESSILRTFTFLTDVISGTTEVLSHDNTMAIEFHSGFHGQARGFVIELSAGPSPAAPTCAGDQFACLNGDCIRGDWECDVFYDCPSGNDESRCEAVDGTCDAHLFACDNGQCIPNSWLCDFIDDCINGEDEDPSNCPE